MRTLIAFVLLSGLAFGQPETWKPLTGTPTTLVPVSGFTAVQLNSSVFKIKGSSTGLTSLGSANASANNYTATLQAASGTVAYTTDLGTVTVAGEAADTTCFPLFATAATGSLLAIKSNAGLTFNASTATLGATGLTVTNNATINGVTIGIGAGVASNVCVAPSGFLNLTAAANNNTAVGNSPLVSLTSGTLNTGIGSECLGWLTTGGGNTAIGYQSLAQLTTGTGNIAVGILSGRYLADGATANDSADNSIYIGNSTRAFSNADDHAIVIGNDAIGVSTNGIVIGTATNTTSRLWGTPTFGGANSLTFSLASLTAARTVTLPNTSGTMTLLGNTSTGSGSVVLGTAPTITAIKNDYVYPAADGTTAWQVRKADGTTAVLNVDTTNARVGIGGIPTDKLDVVGNIVFGTRSTGIATSLSERNTSASYTQPLFYPASGTNIGCNAIMSPRGTGQPTIKARFTVFNTDLVADGANYDAFTFSAGGSINDIFSFKAGTGTGQDIRISANNGTAATNQLYLSTGGGVAVGTSTTTLGKFESRSTSGAQIVASYDANNYATQTVASNGATTFDAVGSGAAFTFSDQIRIPTSTPASASAAGTTGAIAWDASYIYVCTATNTWKRVAIATW